MDDGLSAADAPRRRSGRLTITHAHKADTEVKTPSGAEPRRLPMLFIRDYRGFTGGHLKYLHYLRHTLDSGAAKPSLFMTETSVSGPENIFRGCGAAMVDRLVDFPAYFVAGLDWEWLDAAGIESVGRPVVNLVQHVRHADPADPRYRFLSRPALRLCVSPQIEAALRATGRVDGPIVTVPMGLDIADVEIRQIARRSGRVFIGALKDPPLGVRVADRLRGLPGLDIDLATAGMPRQEFLRRLAEAEIALVIPTPTEGFFLPALEAMAVGTAVVVPDCIGNRSFCRDLQTCLTPPRSVEAMAAAVLDLVVRAELRAID